MGFILITIGILGFYITLAMLIYAFVKKKPKKKALKFLGGSLLLILVGGIISPQTLEKEAIAKKERVSKIEEPKEEKQVAQKSTEQIEKEKQQKKLKELLDVKGSITTHSQQGKIQIKVNTNIADGGILEVSLIDGNINHKSDFIEVNGGKAEVTFDIPADWEPAYFAASAMFRFNLDDYPQPDTIKAIYGDIGENITGDLAASNQLDGQNANFKTVTVAYPNEEAVKSSLNKKFDSAITELKSIGGNIILDITPTSEDWSVVNVVVNDIWYSSPEYEKERFTDQIGNTIINLVNNSGKYEGTVFIYFVDSYGTKLAKPKLIGGWKILK